MPKRIQRRRSKGWKMPAACVSVGRPGRWGAAVCSGCCAQYANQPAALSPRKGLQVVQVAHNAGDCLHCEVKVWLHTRGAAYFRDVRSLAGKDLACWCKVEDSCHGDVLLRLANNLEGAAK